VISPKFRSLIPGKDIAVQSGQEMSGQEDVERNGGTAPYCIILAVGGGYRLEQRWTVRGLIPCREKTFLSSTPEEHSLYRCHCRRHISLTNFIVITNCNVIIIRFNRRKFVRRFICNFCLTCKIFLTVVCLFTKLFNTLGLSSLRVIIKTFARS